MAKPYLASPTVVRLRGYVNSGGGRIRAQRTYSLGLPVEIAVVLTSRGNEFFRAELNDDGSVTFRPVKMVPADVAQR